MKTPNCVKARRRVLSVTLLAVVYSHGASGAIGAVSALDLDTGGAQDLDTGGIHDLDTGGAHDLDTGGIYDLDTGGAYDLDTGGIYDLDTGGAYDLDTGGSYDLDTGGIYDLDTGGAYDLDTGGAHDLDTGGIYDLDTGGSQDLDTGGAYDLDTGGIYDLDTGGAYDLDTGGVRLINVENGDLVSLALSVGRVVSLDASGIFESAQGLAVDFDSGAVMDLDSGGRHVLSGPISAVNPDIGSFEAMGQTVYVSMSMLTQLGEGDYVAVIGTIAGSGHVYADLVGIYGTEYVPGASMVTLEGIPSSSDTSAGSLSIGSLTIDLSSGVSSAGANSDIVRYSGIQPNQGGRMLALP